MPRYYPVFLDLANKTVVVVGGGSVAERKVEHLLDYGARIRVISPAVTPRLDRLAAAGRIELHRRPYRAGDLAGAFLATAATDDRPTNARVYAEATEQGLLINSVDDPAHCNVITPSMVRRGALTIAIGTEGKSPALAKLIRRELEERYPVAYADYVEDLAALRERIRPLLPSFDQREEAWRWMMARGLFDAVQAAQPERIDELIAAAVAEFQNHQAG